MAGPQLGSCASSGHAWWLWAARRSQGGESFSLGAQPPPRVLERAASKAADFTAFDHIQKRDLDEASAIWQALPEVREGGRPACAAQVGTQLDLKLSLALALVFAL